MAEVDDLISEVRDLTLQRRLREAVAALKQRRTFGLVFEEHIPETTALYGLPLHPGVAVQRRDDPKSLPYRVVGVSARAAKIEPQCGGPTQSVPKKELLTIKRFGDPIYPALISDGSVTNGPADRPHHAVINGENFHALQLLTYLYPSSIDCIYIDPPYNTGSRDWKYNNDYVDNTDSWRHSKWLSFMQKRLQLSKRLLRPDGVLIVTIGEHEVIHLGMLLEKLFPAYERHLVTLVHNPKGTGKTNFGRTNEFAFFCCPTGHGEVITGEVVDHGGDHYENWHLRRRGSESSHRHQRWRSFYALLVDVKTRRVVDVGPEIGKDDTYEITVENGLKTYYPISKEGEERTWRYSRETMRKHIEAGTIVTTERYKSGSLRFSDNGSSVSLDQSDLIFHRRVKKKSRKRLKTVWWGSPYDAGTHGTEMLVALLGERNLFPFPKSLYAVRDCIAPVIRDRPNAVVLDFFGGSGTTLHATCLVNAEDSGSRRCILVTNNEVGDKIHRSLVREGTFPGDPEFEKHGIYEAATRPRIEAAILGRRRDGATLKGQYLSGRPYSQGFRENVEFFRLQYLDPIEVDLHQQFDAILPSLWLKAGGVGTREAGVSEDEKFSMPAGSTYGVLLRESAFRRFQRALAKRPDVTHVYLVTDSDEAFSEMCAALPTSLNVSMLYRDYLQNFRINTRQQL